MQTTDPAHVLADLHQRLLDRRRADPARSYVARLYQQGEDKILQKVGEEAIETILAAKSGQADALVYETADLWFHCLVMLTLHDITPEQILSELARRFEQG
ncbi:MAG: phosphoribosyl-ATP diphosphatase [Magnetococcales bacterium]|nr:phosphoribosyl-ATP diphosphatase [Magnetococcales bacterium]